MRRDGEADINAICIIAVISRPPWKLLLPPLRRNRIADNANALPDGLSLPASVVLGCHQSRCLATRCPRHPEPCPLPTVSLLMGRRRPILRGEGHGTPVQAQNLAGSACCWTPPVDCGDNAPTAQSIAWRVACDKGSDSGCPIFVVRANQRTGGRLDLVADLVTLLDESMDDLLARHNNWAQSYNIMFGGNDDEGCVALVVAMDRALNGLEDVLDAARVEFGSILGYTSIGTALPK